MATKKLKLDENNKLNIEIKKKELTDKERENLKKINEENKAKNIKSSNELAMANSLYAQRENEILNKYKSNLKTFLEDRNKQIAEDVRALAERVEREDIKANLEPVIMKIISKPFRRYRSRTNLYYTRTSNTF